MKRTTLAVCTALVLSLTLQAQDQPALKTDKDKTSYMLGYIFGSNLQKEEIEMDTTLFLTAFKQALAGKPSLIPDSVMSQLYSAFSDEMNAKKAMKAKLLADKNRKDGEEFLAANAKKDSVVTLPSGLQYKILRQGTGESPAAADTVVANYKGMFIDGKEFDNSYKRGEPVTFPVGGVIPGWTEALQLMKVGSEWELYIPSSLGYGERGAQSVIPPNSVLVFDVELLKVKKAEAMPTLPETPERPAAKAKPGKTAPKAKTK